MLAVRFGHAAIYEHPLSLSIALFQHQTIALVGLKNCEFHLRRSSRLFTKAASRTHSAALMQPNPPSLVHGKPRPGNGFAVRCMMPRIWDAVSSRRAASIKPATPVT